MASTSPPMQAATTTRVFQLPYASILPGHHHHDGLLHDISSRTGVDIRLVDGSHVELRGGNEDGVEHAMQLLKLHAGFTAAKGRCVKAFTVPQDISLELYERYRAGLSIAPGVEAVAVMRRAEDGALLVTVNTEDPFSMEDALSKLVLHVADKVTSGPEAASELMERSRYIDGIVQVKEKGNGIVTVVATLAGLAQIL